MKETFCQLTELNDIECVCFDNKPCDIHIDDGGQLVCRYGSNEGVINGKAKVICPLEIERMRVNWKQFLEQESNEKY